MSFSPTAQLLPLLLLGVVALPPDASSFYRSNYPVLPPLCTQTPITITTPSSHASHAILREVQLMNFDIGLHTTVCFRIMDINSTSSSPSSYLHTITMHSLQRHYSITNQYTFAIPEVSVSCICECSRSDICNAQRYKYVGCSANQTDTVGTSCYRTFFPSQTSIGCDAEDSPNLCCELKFRPYQNQRYTAVKIENPKTFATFFYIAYDYQAGRWVEREKTRVSVQIDGGTVNDVLDKKGQLSLAISAGGQTAYTLSPGMYFALHNPGGEGTEVREMPLNQPTDYNYERLGWYREEEPGKLTVFNGVVRLDKVHNAKSLNCKDQTYISTLDANFYVPGKFNLSKPLERIKPWIESAVLLERPERALIVTHAEGTNLKIGLKVTGSPSHRVQFVHNDSFVEDFTGSIIVDERSNRYFNVTLINASGKINGFVKAGADSEAVNLHTFATYVNELNAVNKTLIIPLPSSVLEGDRMICLIPEDAPESKRVCRVVKFFETPLQVDMEQNIWHTYIGTCDECNKVTFDNVINYLNPKRWFNGVSNLGELVVMLGDIAIYLGILFILYHVITKVVIPLCKCCNWCVSTIPSSAPPKDKPPKKRTAEPAVHYHINTVNLGPRATDSLCGCSSCSDASRSLNGTPPPRYGARDTGVDV